MTRAESNAAALVTLLPLLEAHLDSHGRIVSRAQWESEYEPPPPGYRPPPPEPTCTYQCPPCPDHNHRCTLREERWASEWLTLRRRYPELLDLEYLLSTLMWEHPNWAVALYWVYIQPWDMWHRERSDDYARLGVEWMVERVTGWLPTYVPPGMPEPDPVNDVARRIVALRVQRNLSHGKIAAAVGCGKSYVRDVLRARKVR